MLVYGVFVNVYASEGEGELLGIKSNLESAKDFANRFNAEHNRKGDQDMAFVRRIELDKEYPEFSFCYHIKGKWCFCEGETC